jgi:hypothetical protein
MVQKSESLAGDSRCHRGSIPDLNNRRKRPLMRRFYDFACVLFRILEPQGDRIVTPRVVKHVATIGAEHDF